MAPGAGSDDLPIAPHQQKRGKEMAGLLQNSAHGPMKLVSLVPILDRNNYIGQRKCSCERYKLVMVMDVIPALKAQSRYQARMLHN